MATEQNFVSVPLDGRDVSLLEQQLRDHAGADAVTLTGSASSGLGTATVRVPIDPEKRSAVLRIVSEWRDATGA